VITFDRSLNDEHSDRLSPTIRGKSGSYQFIGNEAQVERAVKEHFIGDERSPMLRDGFGILREKASPVSTKDTITKCRSDGGRDVVEEKETSPVQRIALTIRNEVHLTQCIRPIVHTNYIALTSHQTHCISLRTRTMRYGSP
jgi:hypothetical protein